MTFVKPWILSHSLNIVEILQLRWFGQVTIVSKERLAKQISLTTPTHVKKANQWLGDVITFLTCYGPTSVWNQQKCQRLLKTEVFQDILEVLPCNHPRWQAGVKSEVKPIMKSICLSICQKMIWGRCTWNNNDDKVMQDMAVVLFSHLCKSTKPETRGKKHKFSDGTLV